MSVFADSLTVTFDFTDPNQVGDPDLTDASDSPDPSLPGYQLDITNKDNLTNVTSPTFSVAGVEAGATLQLFRVPLAGGTPAVVQTLQNVAGGTVTIQDPGTVPDGVYVYTVQQFDKAGNPGPVSGGLTVTIDATRPAAPVAPDLQEGDDSPAPGQPGYIKGVTGIDNITKVNSNIHFDVVGVEPRATLQLLRAPVVGGVVGMATVVRTRVDVAGGTVTIIDPGVVPDGVYRYTVQQYDLAGNLSLIDGFLTITIDTTMPVKPPAPDLVSTGTDASDTGVSTTDNVTAITLQHDPYFDIATVEGTATVELYRDGVLVNSVASGAGGTIRLADPVPVPDGVHLYTTRQIDTAGNASAQSDALAVTIDTTAPPAPLAPDLQAASDTGVSDTDNQTSVTNPTFDVSGLEIGATVKLLRDGLVIKTVTDVTTATVAIQDDGKLSQGPHRYTAFQVDPAGNASPIGGELLIMVDTSGPSTPMAPDLQAASDSGASNTDNITKITTPTFDIVGVELAAVVELLRKPLGAADTAYVVAATRTGPGSLTDFGNGTLGVPDGTYEYAVRQKDMTGNSGPISTTLAVTIDTVVNAPDAPDLQAASDSGTFNNDNLTNATSPNFTLSGVETGATVTLLRKLLGAAATFYAPVANRIGNGGLTDLGPVSDGQYSYAARQTDIAGNTSIIGAELGVTIDTTPFGAPSVPDLQAASDSGTSNTDNLTSIASPVLDVLTADPTATVQLLRNGVLVGTRTGPGPIPDTVVPLASGVYLYTARQIDAADNPSLASAGLTVTVDRDAPPGPGIPDLQDASDSGTSHTDNITSTSTNLGFTIPSTEAGATVNLLRDGVIVQTLKNAPGGPVTLIDAGSVSSGVHHYTARQTDRAGNVGSESQSLAVTIELDIPPTPSAPDLLATSDSGPRNTDNVTNAATPVFQIVNAQAGARVELLRKPFGAPDNAYVRVGVITGPGNVTDAGPVLDGTYQYASRQIGAAGGTSALSSPLTVTIDGAAPQGVTAQLVKPPVAPAGNVTSSRRPSFQGTTEPGALVELLDDLGAPIASTNANLSGAFTLTVPDSLRNGQYTYRLRARDVAGNQGSAGTPIDVKVVTVNGDFSGDGKANLTLFRTQTADWLIQASSPNAVNQKRQFGAAYTDQYVVGDFDGDGRDDFAVYRPGTTGTWYIIQSTDGPRVEQFGATGDVPVAADYDGDGKADIAVFRPGSAEWLIKQSTGGISSVQFGWGGHDVPAPADYDGDGKADIATFRPENGTWYLRQSTNGPRKQSFGGWGGGDVAVPADYDGDGKADIATYRGSEGNYYILQSSDGPRMQAVGVNGDVAAPADYDGDGKADPTTFRHSSGNWQMSQSTLGSQISNFGNGTLDKPVLSPKNPEPGPGGPGRPVQRRRRPGQRQRVLDHGSGHGLGHDPDPRLRPAGRRPVLGHQQHQRRHHHSDQRQRPERSDPPRPPGGATVGTGAGALARAGRDDHAAAPPAGLAPELAAQWPRLVVSRGPARGRPPINPPQPGSVAPLDPGPTDPSRDTGKIALYFHQEPALAP